MRLKARYGAAAVLVVIAISLGGLVWQMVASLSARRNIIFRGNEALAQSAGVMMASELRARLRVVEGIAARPDFAQRVAAQNWGATEVFVEALRELDPQLGSAAVFDAEGHLWARDPADPSILGQDFSGRDYFRGALSTPGAYLSETFQQKGTPQAVVVAFSAAVRDSGRVVGVLQATMPIGRLERLASQVPVPNSGSIQVFDQSGHKVTGASADPDRSDSSHPLVSKALSGVAGSGEFKLPGLEGMRFVAYAPIPDVKWAVLVEQPLDAALEPVRELWRRLGAVAGVVLLAGIVASFLLNRLIRTIERERKRTSAILVSAADAVITTDTQGIVKAINPAFERLTGWSEAEAVGRRYAEVVPLLDAQGERVPSKERLLTKAIVTGGPVVSRRFDLRLVTKDGDWVPVSISAAPILDEEGNPIGGVDVIRDVSNEREVDEMKSALVSTVSHELRTPLTMIQGFSELLLSREFDRTRSMEALQQINSSAERLARLIDDLLSVARIEAGRLSPKRSPVDIEAIIDEVTRPFSRHRDVTMSVDENLPRGLADRDMCIQILTNLVSNAAKYSPTHTPITISARLNRPSIEVAVKDEGIGLTEDDLARLFEKFHRVDRGEVRDAGGTGLGLFITKSLVELQGGAIWVTSTPGVGSTFTFSIPVAPEATEEEN